VLPSIAVYRIRDHYCLADGWFRLKAAASLGHETIECRIYAGDDEGDILDYYGAANAAHGAGLTVDELAHAALKVMPPDALPDEDAEDPGPLNADGLPYVPWTLEDLEQVGLEGMRREMIPYAEEIP
jgi:hypothetical protein